MIKVTLQNIRDFDLPLDTAKEIVKRGESKRVLKRLEKKYKLKSHYVCGKIDGKHRLYANAAYFYVSYQEKELWIKTYETYVKSSAEYKFWIMFHKLV